VFDRVALRDPGDPQEDAEASYAGFFDDEYGELDWTWPADEIHRRVRAWSFMFAWGAGARADLDGRERQLLRTRVERGVTEGNPGDVLRRDGEALLVRCGEDAVWVLDSLKA
jgi:methionyl-tRNA formyltransferase